MAKKITFLVFIFLSQARVSTAVDAPQPSRQLRLPSGEATGWENFGGLSDKVAIKSFPVTIHNYTQSTETEELEIRMTWECNRTITSTNILGSIVNGGLVEDLQFENCGRHVFTLKADKNSVVTVPDLKFLESAELQRYTLSAFFINRKKNFSISTRDGIRLTPDSNTKNFEVSLYEVNPVKFNLETPQGEEPRWRQDNYISVLVSLAEYAPVNSVTGELVAEFNEWYMANNRIGTSNPRLFGPQFLIANRDFGPNPELTMTVLSNRMGAAKFDSSGKPYDYCGGTIVQSKKVKYRDLQQEFEKTYRPQKTPCSVW